MEQIQEAKEGLFVYLQANRQYIEEKVYNEFNVECIELKTIDTLNIQKMKSSIKDIFDFGDNKVYEYFFSHLENNIKEYVAEQYKAKAIASFYVIDVQKLTDIVKFCINHGFDYEAAKMKDQKKAEANNTINTHNVVIPTKTAAPQQKKQPQPKSEFAHVKPRISTFLDPKNIPDKKEFKLEKYSMPQTKVQPRYLISIPKNQTIIKEEQPLSLVVPLEQNYLQQHRKTIRERLEKLFNFYCVQQQSLGHGPTFDRIKGQGESMNLGCFMQFCQYTKVFLCKELPKEVLITQFKKVSEGKTFINFDIFEKLVTQTDEKYLQAMGHDPANNPIPTYQARLLLNEPTKLGELKRHRNLIFGTRIKQGRQTVKIDSSARYGTKQLTAHSGRFSSDLTLDLKSKVLLTEKELVKTKRSDSGGRGPVNLTDLKKLRLPKLNWIEEEEDEFLKKQYAK